MYNPPQVASFLQAPVTAGRFGWGLQVTKFPFDPTFLSQCILPKGKAPQQSSAQPSWSRLSPQGLSQNESQSSTERCQSQALIPAWILLISLETSRERFTHPREGRSLAQGDWAAGLEQSPELSQGFSERQREGGKLWLFGEQKAVNSHSHCMLS